MRIDHFLNLLFVLPLLGFVVAVGTAFVLADVSPLLAAVLPLFLLFSGLLLVAVAKRSLFVRGIWISFGSSSMGTASRHVYRTGYGVLLAGAMLTLGMLLVWWPAPG